jgi:hypothetical protein
MPRNTFKRWMPTPHKIREHKALKFFGVLLHDPNLFHLNRHSVSVAFFVGIFLCFLPIPFQVPLAAMGALWLRCNLPLAVTLVWISNPLTFPFIFIACHQFGAQLLGLPARNFEFELSWAWFQSEFLLIWQPLLLGSVLAGLFFGSLGYLLMQWTWRWNVIKKWEKRKTQRLKDKGIL